MREGGAWSLTSIALRGAKASRASMYCWRTLIPASFLVYSFSYLDRLNFGYGAAAGMGDDLGISPSQLSLVGSLTFLGYFLCQVPAALLARRIGGKNAISIAMFLWGPLSAATGLISNINVLYIDRFFLGCVESAVLPALFILSTHWFSAVERGKAMSIIIMGGPVTLAMMSVISAFLASKVGWRGMFILEGLPPIFLVWIWMAVIVDTPRRASRMISDSYTKLDALLCDEQNIIEEKANAPTARLALKTAFLGCLYFWWSLAAYGFTIWSPTLLRNGGMTLIEVGWLSALLYVLVICLKLLCSYYSDRWRTRIPFLWPFFVLSVIACFVWGVIGSADGWRSQLLFLAAGIGANAPAGIFFAFIADLIPRRISGGSFAFINGMGALGSFMGSYIIGIATGASAYVDAPYLMLTVTSLITLMLCAALPYCKPAPDQDRAALE